MPPIENFKGFLGIYWLYGLFGLGLLINFSPLQHRRRSL